MKVVCRYQQYRAARRIVSGCAKEKRRRVGRGVAYTRLGKSLTMVFVARMLRTSTDLAVRDIACTSLSVLLSTGRKSSIAQTFVAGHPDLKSFDAPRCGLVPENWRMRAASIRVQIAAGQRYP